VLELGQILAGEPSYFDYLGRARGGGRRVSTGQGAGLEHDVDSAGLGVNDDDRLTDQLDFEPYFFFGLTPSGVYDRLAPL
jgi:hypothetical protein